MPFSDSDLRALKAGPKRMVVGAGNSLFVVVESVGKGGGKSFVGRTRFPPGGLANRWRSESVPTAEEQANGP